MTPKPVSFLPFLLLQGNTPASGSTDLKTQQAWAQFFLHVSVTLGRPLDSCLNLICIFNQVIPLELDRIRPSFGICREWAEWNGGLAGSCPGIQVKDSGSGGGSEQTQQKCILWEDWTGLEGGLEWR